MFLSVISPQGQVSSLDLGALEVWRLELHTYSGSLDDPDSKNMLALVFRYVIAGTTALQPVVAVDCRCTSELSAVLKIGLAAGGRDGDKARLREVLKVLHNKFSDAETKAVFQSVDKLVDIYHDFLGALFGQRPQALAGLDAIMMGEALDWKYALTAMRHQPWLVKPSAQASGLGPSPGMGAALPAAPGAGRGKRTGKKDTPSLGALPPPPAGGDLKPVPDL